MPSQRERRALADVEQALRAEVPELDLRLRDLPARARTRRVIAVMAAVGLVLLAVAFELRSADALLVSALILRGAASWPTIRAFARLYTFSASHGRGCRRIAAAFEGVDGL